MNTFKVTLARKIYNSTTIAKIQKNKHLCKYNKA